MFCCVRLPSVTVGPAACYRSFLLLRVKIILTEPSVCSRQWASLDLNVYNAGEHQNYYGCGAGHQWGTSGVHDDHRLSFSQNWISSVSVSDCFFQSNAASKAEIRLVSSTAIGCEHHCSIFNFGRNILRMEGLLNVLPRGVLIRRLSGNANSSCSSTLQMKRWMKILPFNRVSLFFVIRRRGKFVLLNVVHLLQLVVCGTG